MISAPHLESLFLHLVMSVSAHCLLSGTSRAYSQAGLRKSNVAVIPISIPYKLLHVIIRGIPRLSAIPQAAAVHCVTSSKKGPHKQSSSVLGSQFAVTAAWFQQSVCCCRQHMLLNMKEHRGKRRKSIQDTVRYRASWGQGRLSATAVRTKM
jgi:hypothetical protein